MRKHSTEKKMVIVALLSLALTLVSSLMPLNTAEALSLAGGGTLTCSPDGKPIETAIFAGGSTWTLRTEGTADNHTKQGSIDNASTLQNGQFVYKGIETLDKICNNPIDLSNPPNITFTGQCDVENEEVRFASSNNETGYFNAFEACSS